MTSRREQMTGRGGGGGRGRSRSSRSLVLGHPHNLPHPHRHPRSNDGGTTIRDATAAADETAAPDVATPETTPRRRNGGLSRAASAGRRLTGSDILHDFERRSYGADVVPDPPSILDWRGGDIDNKTDEGPASRVGAFAEPPEAAGDEKRRLFAGSSSSDVNGGGGGGQRDVLLKMSSGGASAADAASHRDGASSTAAQRQLASPPPAPIHLLSTPRAGSGGGGHQWLDAANNGAMAGSRRSLGSAIPSRTGDDFSLEWSLDDGDEDDDDDSDWGDDGDEDEDGIVRYRLFMHGQRGKQRSQRTLESSLPDEDDDEYVTAYRLRLRRMLDAEEEEDEDGGGAGGRSGRRRARRETARRRTRLLALAVLAIAATAISVALRSHADGSSGPLPEQVEGGGGRVVLPDRHDADPTEEERLLLELLAGYTPMEVLRNSTSPQHRSMRWLLRSDGGDGGASSTTASPVTDPFFRAYIRDGPIASKKIAFEGSLLTQAVVERYALVTLYYSTNGDGGGDEDGDGGTTPSGPVVVDDAETASSLRKNGGGGTNVVTGSVGVISSGWKDASGWLSPYHHCEWAGVVCSRGKGYRREITELRLSGNRLRGGPLPAELGALERLEGLHLGGGNDITGALPPEGLFGRLLRLKELRLEGNGLTGPLPIDLGGEWSPLEEDGNDGSRNAGALEVLDLTNNRISGPLPSSLGRLDKLSALRLSNNRLGGDLGDALLVLGGLDALEVLLLDGNAISGSIPESNGRLPSLRRLRLSNNAIVDSVPRSVGEWGNLLELDLSHNRLDGTLPVGGNEEGGSAGLDGLTSLETLVLSGNAFHGRIFESLFAGGRPSGLSELRRLRLDGNAFSGTIAPWVSGENLVALEELYLSDNSFSGGVPAELGSLTTLRDLALEGNDLVGAIPESLCRLHLQLLSADCGDGGDGGNDGSTMTCSCCTECVG